MYSPPQGQDPSYWVHQEKVLSHSSRTFPPLIPTLFHERPSNMKLHFFLVQKPTQPQSPSTAPLSAVPSSEHLSTTHRSETPCVSNAEVETQTHISHSIGVSLMCLSHLRPNQISSLAKKWFVLNRKAGLVSLLASFLLYCQRFPSKCRENE